jgi:hypothetical protein
MQLHSNAGGRAHRLALGMIVAATLAATVTACSSSSSTAKHVAATQQTAAAPAATTPATSASASAAAAPAPGALSGKWLGHYSGAYQGTFTLKWLQSQSKLGGTIHLSNPARGTLPIHGSVTGNVIRFGTVGSVGITYSGTVSGNSMSGTYQIHTPQGSVGGPWNASRSS